jgi:hypothetical protein
MGSTVNYLPIIDQSADKHVATEIDLEEIQEARRDPVMHALLRDAAAEGVRVEREGRQRW